MDLILCHQTADFDVLGAAVGLSQLKQGSRIVLTGGAHPAVRDFLALHRDEFALIELRSVNTQQIRSLIVIDNQYRDRLGKAANWLDLPELNRIEVYDHHIDSHSDIASTVTVIEPVGATTTIIVEKLQKAGIKLNTVEATVMALGIHVDTGSLTFEQSTVRDALALAWLMQQGAKISTIAEYVDPGFSPQLQQIFSECLELLKTHSAQGYAVSSLLLETETFIFGLSSVVERLLAITESDALIFAHAYHSRREGSPAKEGRLSLIARTRIENTNLAQLFQAYGGGGHAQAASCNLRGVDPQQTLDNVLNQFLAQIPQPLTARDLMSSPVRTIRPQTTIKEAQRILFRYGHSGLSVVDESDRLVGIISRRDLDLALHHGFSHAPVKGYMTRNLKTIAPEALLPEIESLMVTYDIGRLPVIEQGQLVGIVTRTDLLRQIHQERQEKNQESSNHLVVSCLLPSLQHRLKPSLSKFLQQAAKLAQDRGWHLYLVGGAVRDLLLATDEETVVLQDVDLVVDGFHQSADVGAGVELAQELQKTYPQARLSVHGQFQTAALLWHRDDEFDSLWVDIATSRTEFYPYPAANPEVEASSIRQDLYRRDFTINALSIRLTSPRAGNLLDFFGGLLDLRSHQIRVLHANSFIEDPTRIYRAVRFAVRLNFAIEPQTEDYIHYAIESGIYEQLRLKTQPAPALTTRLKAELHYILEAGYWREAVILLADLDALRCLHPDLVLSEELWWQIRCLSRWLRFLDPNYQLEHWRLRLEILLSALPVNERSLIAANLQLPKDSIERLEDLAKLEANIQENLPTCKLTSQIVKLLKPYRLPSLVLVAVRSPKSIRRTLWQYLTLWSQISAPLNGNDLKQMNLKPGPQYKAILDALLAATLDGEICNRQQAMIKVEQMIKEF